METLQKVYDLVDEILVEHSTGDSFPALASIVDANRQGYHPSDEALFELESLIHQLRNLKKVHHGSFAP